MAEARNIVSSISEFNASKEQWVNYKRRLDAWMRINKIQDDEKVDAMLAVIGPEPVDLLVSLCAPTKIEDKNYTELSIVLESHYRSGTNELAESYTFDTRVQTESETVEDYIVAIKKLSIHSGFGDEAQIKKRLRNKLVAGVRNDSIKNKLLSEGAALTWDRAVEISTTMDAAQRNSKKMRTTQEQEIAHVSRGRGTFQRGRGRGRTRQPNKKCYRCDGNHQGECPFVNSKCYKCKKVGHIAKACKTRQRGQYFGKQRGKGRAHHLENDPEPESDPESLFSINNGKSKSHDEIIIPVQVNGIDLSFSLDTASRCSIIGEAIYKEFLSAVPLEETLINLKSYTGHAVELLGQIPVTVKYGSQCKKMTLIVAKGDRTALFGREWLKQIHLDWENIFSVQSSHNLEELLSKYSSVFSSDMGEIKNFEAHIEMANVTPKFHKARPVPYALVEGVKKELDRLESSDIITKIERSEWASPIVVVPKTDGSLRLCGDYKVSINKDMVDQPYTLPTAEAIFATLAGGNKFSKIDLSQAYAQVKMDEQSKIYLTINTIKGLYKVNRLPYGIKTAPHIFQSIMDQILQNIPGVCCYIDDILVTAPSDKEHLKRLESVLERLQKHNIRAKKTKCSFMAKEVRYLGHVIDKEGRHPFPEKVDGIKDANPPNNVSELRSFLGMVNYYGSYIRNLSTMLAPLNKLLRVDTKWKWDSACKRAFKEVKEALTSEVLTHYDPEKELILACDASPYGVGTVLSHIVDGKERPIAFASRSLTKSEQSYAQVEKEALGIIFGIKKFHKYLYGRKFLLITDHKCLTTIFGPKTGVPTLAALRLQRWALLLMTYDYEIKYRKSKDHANADYLSRAPVEKASKNLESELNYFTHVNDMPVSSEQIAGFTRKDKVLARVLDFTLNGWPNNVEYDLKPYFNRRNELSCDQGCLLLGMRVVIPEKLCQRMLEELHHEHLGVVRMKALARSYLWFPGIDKAIESLVKSCPICLSLKNDPPLSPLYPWKYPERPWDRVHIDFAEYKSEMFFVAVDSYSKWLEVTLMKSTTAEKTVEALKDMFSRYGLCREIVSDNGPQFISEYFQNFLQKNRIKHTLTAPYHAASNGAAEKAVQTLKNALKKHSLEAYSGLNTKQKLNSFLLSYRTTPHSTTGVTPSELFMKRQLRTRLSMIKPDIQSKIQEKQEKMKENRDKRVPKLREFVKNERVRVKNCRGSDIKYVPGVIIDRKGPVQYLVRVGRTIRFVHVDHLIKSSEVTEDTEETTLPLSTPNHEENIPVHTPEPVPIHPTEIPVVPPECPDNIPEDDTLPESPKHSSPKKLTPKQTPKMTRPSPKPKQMDLPPTEPTMLNPPRRSQRKTCLPKKLSKDFVLSKP